MTMILRLLILGFSFVLAGCLADDGSGRVDINTILGGQIVNGYALMDGSVRKPDTLQSATIAGRNAIRFLLRYEDEGQKEDWYRYGKPGEAQRIQFIERNSSKTMRLGEEYWFSITFLAESFPPTDKSVLSLFDLKPIPRPYNGRVHPSLPVFATQFQYGTLVAYDSFGVKFECGEYVTANGMYNSACDRQINTAILGPQASFSNRWVNVVFHVKWANDETGVFRYWVDGRNRFTFRGRTASGGETFTFKFGPYRNNMEGYQPPAAVSFSEVTRASTCEGLGISNCAQLEASGRSPGRRNLAGFHTNLALMLTNLRRDPTDNSD